MIAQDEINNWDSVHNAQEIQDIYSLYLHSAEHIAWTQLIPMLKHESGSEASLYNIACMIKIITEGE